MTINELPEPDYGYTLVRVDGFDDLLRSGDADHRTIGFQQVMELGERSGRLLLQAPGGAGKSLTLQRLESALVAEGRSVHRLNLVATPALKGADGDTTLPLDLVYALCEPPISEDLLSVGGPTWLIADGVNEVGPMAEPLLRALNDLAATMPNVTVAASDRLTRRNLLVTAAPNGRAGRWILLTLTEVPLDTINSIVGGAQLAPDVQAALRNPYFLSIWRDGTGSSAEMVRAWIADVGRLDEPSLDALSELALSQYAKHRSRWLDTADVRAVLGGHEIQALLASQILHGSEEQGYFFQHQLVGDYLSARSVARQPERWGEELFDALTLRASSFDPLALLLDLVSTAQHGVALAQTDIAGSPDRLAREIYDWNYYGAVFLISTDIERLRAISRQTSLPILFMVASRRFDRFISTSTRSQDAIGALHDAEARLMLEAATLDALVANAVSKSDEVPQQWLSLFRRLVERKSATDADLDILKSADSILGWAASNAVKASTLPDDIDAALCDLVSADASPVVRWRTAHALGGASTSERSVTALFAALDEEGDAHRWVRYGALRSLIERAASDDGLREQVFIDLAKRAGTIATDPLLRRDIKQAVRVDNQPHDWASCVSLLLDELWARESSAAEQDAWQKLESWLHSNEGK